MWRKHAVVALGHRQISLVAEVVALEIVDDIIDFMLEGTTHPHYPRFYFIRLTRE